MTPIHRKYVRTNDVVEADVNGDTVLLHTANWHYFEFDPVGDAIWKMLDEPRSVASLVEKLMARFEVSEEQCTADTERFLNEMMEQELIVVSDI